MTDNDPELRDLARRLLEREMAGGSGSVALAAAALRVWGKLSGQLVPLIGPGGFEAVAARALRHTASLHPFLRGIQLSDAASPTLSGLQEKVTGRDSGEVRDAITVLLASLMDLLVALLGHELPRRLLKSAWPGVRCHGDPSLSGK